MGDTQNGLPHGKGKFTTTEPSGEKWSYDGDWVNGHMHGTGLITRGAGNFEYGQYANDVRREKVKVAGDEELTNAEIDSLFTGGAHKLCGRQLSVSGRVLEIAADGQGVLVTVQLAQTGFGSGRQVDLYLSESLYSKVAVQEGQAVSVTGVYCGQRAVKSAEQEGAYVYIPRIYVNRISL